MSAQRVVTCRTCEAEIIFAVDSRGRKHPIDAKLSQAWILRGGEWEFVMAHHDHFETCP